MYMTIAATPGRRSPMPREEWPGREVTEDDVINASGNERDMFSQEQHLAAFRAITASHHAARNAGRIPRAKYTSELVVGDPGEGKSKYSVVRAAKLYSHGIPFFHNGGPLFGRVIGDNDVFTVLGRAPVNSIIFLDEVHSINEAGAENSRTQRLQNQSLAGRRKYLVVLLMATAEEDQLGGRLKRSCEYLTYPKTIQTLPGSWRPFDGDESLRRTLGLANRHAPPTGNVFQMGVHRISDYPFRRDGMAEDYGINVKRDPSGLRPTRFFHIPPSWVCLSMLLNDSFAPIRLGVGMTRNRDAIVQSQREFLEASDSGGRASAGAVLEYYERVAFSMHEAFRTGTLKTSGNIRQGDLFHVLQRTSYGMGDLTARRMGQTISEHYQMPYGSNGYNCMDLREAVARHVEMVSPGNEEP